MEQKSAVPPSPPQQQSSFSTTRTARPTRKKHRQWLWILVLLLIFAGIFYFVLRKGNNAKPATAAAGGRRGAFGGPVTLTVATAKQGDIGVYLDGIGYVTPVYTATIYNQVVGVITAVHYREWQTVRKGDPLVDIDPRQYQANVDTATGNLARDTNVLAQAKMDLARYQDAWKRNAIAKQTLDDQEKTVLQDEGTVQSDQGALAYDKVQLGYCHIVAPFAGKVGLRLVDPGNLMQSSGTTALAVITQMQPTTVVFTISEDNLEQVLAQFKHGNKLTVEAWDRESKNKLGTGTLTAFDNQIDTTTGTLKLRATFDNKQETLFPNQFVNTRLLVETQHNMTLIPTNAIQHNGDEAFVYVIQNGKKPNEKVAKIQDVKSGTANEGLTAVTGIKPGDTVATSSFEKLVNGSTVNIAKTPPTTSGTPAESNAP
jgi:membrane fusion protein, multidrug efflux system